MKTKKEKISKPYNVEDAVPFENAQEAWFWFIAAQEARADGAKIVAGQGAYKRPCEPLDILKVMDRLYRKRRLLRDHLLVLRHYGRRKLAPDRYRAKEVRAFQLWTEALERIGDVLEAKGVIEPQKSGHINWAHEALLYQNTEMDFHDAR